MSLTFEQIINKYRENSTSERNKGDKFERLMKAYLLTKPAYKTILSNVWLWSEFPYRNKFGKGGKDTGIDIVCRTHDGDYWAVQCKCYCSEAKIDNNMVNNFVATSKIKFETNEGQKEFEHLIWIDTTFNGFNAEATNSIIKHNISHIGLIDLKNDDVNWEELDAGKKGDEALKAKFDLRPHQKEAFDKTIDYFKTHERGKLIMACGTGKTFTSLRIAEALSTESHLTLFLVPSIALLSQTLKEWSAQSNGNIYPVCICSDSHATDKAEDSISDLVLPATTDSKKVYKQFIDYRKRQAKEGGMIVVFSTYQSIDVISSVQKEINKAEKDSFIFDLIVCDEAHRTTGIKQKNQDQTAFTKVHSNDNIKSRKRLYMTATPRLYSSEAQAKAKEKEVMVWSMDDPESFGEEIYRIGFGMAVDKQLLSDYKVIVLTLDESSVDKDILNNLSENNKEIKGNDAIKLIGCINVLSKRTNYLTDKKLFSDDDPKPMRSAVAFCSSIRNSQYLCESFKSCRKAYNEKLSEEEREKMVEVVAHHIDGCMGSINREKELDWLKHADINKNECRVLNNVRCLSEGIDVPSLDAIMFLSSRNSQVDVVQSVGRVMRKAEGKKFGYIIIPVIVPQDKKAEEVLDKSDDFKIVWSVLNALRAHDDRFNATINKIELNKSRPHIINVTGGGNFGGKPVVGDVDDGDTEIATQTTFTFDELQQELYNKFQSLSDKVFAKMVTKCGNKRYWADWGKEVGEIAKKNIARINKLISIDGEHKKKFNAYWEGLKKNINPSVTQIEAVEMLAQHIITKPIFEALFGNNHFTKENAVSKSLEDIVALLDEKSDPEDLEKLERFYKSVQQRVEGIDNAEGKQKIVVELYDSFFKNAFPLTVEKLGIVYTPVPVVDFILHSTEYVLNKEFGRSLSDEKVNIIDPFTGTGTFITRLLQSGIIKPEDLKRKYEHEIFANEIVLLAYYIASVNIENTYHDLLQKQMLPQSFTVGGAVERSETEGVFFKQQPCLSPEKNKSNLNNKIVYKTEREREREREREHEEGYTPFNGICLTDTFQLYENGQMEFEDKIFEANSDRVKNQRKQPITVVVGNPPYSVGQKSANDNAQNQNYSKLEKKIADTYVALSRANLNKATYDSYIKAFRWASDRLDKNDGGVIAFVSNGAWIDNNGLDGFRKDIEQEFSSIYIFNLRGNCRTSGELRRKESGNVFGEGSRTPISITVLVKKPNKSGKAKILYHDIGDYLAREEKLKMISEFHDIGKMELVQLTPNEHGDWINQRNDMFGNWIPLESKKKYDIKSQSFFIVHSLGIATNKDYLLYDYSNNELIKKVNQMISFYNEQRLLFNSANNKKLDAKSFVTYDSNKINWTDLFLRDLEKNIEYKFCSSKITDSVYRPFCKQRFVYEKQFLQRTYQQLSIFPTLSHKNLVICLKGIGDKDFSCLISNCIPDLQFVFNGQCFPLYWYEVIEPQQGTLFGSDEQIIRHEAISDFILKRAQSKYGNKVQREDIFYYVYGILHSKSYRETFSADLKKMLPRIPLISDFEKFWAFSKAGRDLAELHLNYENVEASKEVNVVSLERPLSALRATSPTCVGADLHDETPSLIAAETTAKFNANYNDNNSNNSDDYAYYEVQQMKFPKKGEKSIIIYNKNITISNIPEKAYQYVVNGKSAIEWIMERYAITTDKKSGITNDPNDWSREHNKPRYIIDLLLSVINVSLKTVDIVDALPEVDWEKE